MKTWWKLALIAAPLAATASVAIAGTPTGSLKLGMAKPAVLALPWAAGGFSCEARRASDPQGLTVEVCRHAAVTAVFSRSSGEPGRLIAYVETGPARLADQTLETVRQQWGEPQRTSGTGAGKRLTWTAAGREVVWQGGGDAFRLEISDEYARRAARSLGVFAAR